MKIPKYLMRGLAAAVLLSSVALHAAESFMAPPGLVTTPSGLQYVLTKQGEGEKPRLTSDQIVLINFSVKLPDGKTVREYLDPKNPFPYIYGVGRPIDGWNEALHLMRVGDKGIFILTPELAFGKIGDSGVPSNSPVRIDIEILGLQENLAEKLGETISTKGVDAAREQLAQAKQSGFAGMYRNDRLLAKEGRELLEKKKNAEALALLQWTVELYPDSAMAQGLLGDAYFQQGDKEKAVLSFAKSLELNPRDGAAMPGLTRVFPPKPIVIENIKWGRYRALVRLAIEAVNRGDVKRAALAADLFESFWNSTETDLVKTAPEKANKIGQAREAFVAAAKAAEADPDKIRDTARALNKLLREEG